MISRFKEYDMTEILLAFSHILAFSVFFIDSLFDIFNNHDIPDEFAAVGVLGGLTLHGAYSYVTGSPEAFIWSLGVGLAFSAYGWTAYWKGLWGGADAFAMSALGFMAPGTVSGVFSAVYILDMIFNFMLGAAVLTVIYSFYKFFQNGGNPKMFLDQILEDEKFLSVSILGAGAMSALLSSQNINGYVFFGVISLLLILYEFMKVVEDSFMVSTVATENLEGGEVPAPDEGFGKKIKGLTEEDIESIEKDEIEVRTGVPFLPVFLVALVLTDLTSSGMWLLHSIY